MDIDLEFFLDFSSKDKSALLLVANKAMREIEKEVPGLYVKSQQVFIPSDAALICWKLVVDGQVADPVRKALPFWFRFFAAKAGQLPQKAREVLIEEMRARGLSEDVLPRPAKLF